MPRHGTTELAERVASFSPADASAAAKESAALCLLDGVAGATAGFDAPAARAARTWALADSGSGAASVWWAGRRLPVAAAALANSAAASALDVDDGHPAAPGHPGAGIVPAALAAAQETRASREQLLTALVIGYEVAIRVAAARRTAHVGTSGHWVGHGVVAAVGWLRGLETPVLAQALAVVSAQRPVVLVDGGPANNADGTKEGIPWATLTAAVSVDLVQAGMTGPVHALDDGTHDEDLLIGNWGRPFYIETATHKAYACCRWFHPSIDAFREITEAAAVPLGEIRRIHVATFGHAANQHNSPDPATLEQAQYSLPFCLAVTACRGADGLLPLASDALDDPAVLQLARRVVVEVDPAFEASYAENAAQQRAAVTVETTAGTVLRRQVDVSRGMVGNALGQADLVAKFEALAAKVFGHHERERLIAALLDIDMDATALGDRLEQAVRRSEGQ